jgi:peptidoglycan/xylan/chitin deacetylase (PgdA/CDA1 family)
VACAVALVAGSCELLDGGRDSIETPLESSNQSAGDDAAGAPAPSTTTTSIEVNDLLAPPPTVVPELTSENGLAPQIRRVDTTDRVIFITIDDGQVRDPAVLDYMVGLGLPFTSFLTEPMAEADPEFWKGTQSAWGIIETHTINHPDLRKAGESTQEREICAPADTFEELFGRRPTLFRPPYGNSSDSVRRIAADCGYDAVVLWTGSTNNGKLTMQDVELEPGDIILMHYRDTLRADLDDVLARARAEGFTIGRLQDYLSPGR